MMLGLGWALNPMTDVLTRRNDTTQMAVMRRWRQKWGFSTTSQGTCLSALKIQPCIVICPDCLTIRHHLYHLLLSVFRSRSVYNLPNHLNSKWWVWSHGTPPLARELVWRLWKPLVSECYLQEWGLSCGGGTRGPRREASLVKTDQSILRWMSHSLAQGWRYWDGGIHPLAGLVLPNCGPICNCRGVVFWE